MKLQRILFQPKLRQFSDSTVLAQLIVLGLIVYFRWKRHKMMSTRVCRRVLTNSLEIVIRLSLLSFTLNSLISVDKLDLERLTRFLDQIHFANQKNWLTWILLSIQAKERGLISRALQSIFASLESSELVYWISFMEIYNERIFDLFSCDKSFTPLDLRENKAGEVQIPELTHVNVSTYDEAIEWIHLGISNRMIGSSHANRHSSRSHCIFQILRVAKDGKGGMKCLSALRIVDLAGSEKFKLPRNISKEEKEIRLQELTSINGSLSTLGHCVSALIERNRTHIPYRNSKLTRVLANCFNGNSQIHFVICVSPCSAASAETLSTLHFAKNAKNAVLEERKTPKVKSAIAKKYDEIREAYEKEKGLREELEKDLNSLDRSKLVSEVDNLKKENLRLKRELTNLRSLNVSPITRSKTPTSALKRQETPISSNSAKKNLVRIFVDSGVKSANPMTHTNNEIKSNFSLKKKNGRTKSAINTSLTKIKEFWGDFPTRNSCVEQEKPPEHPSHHYHSESLNKQMPLPKFIFNPKSRDPSNSTIFTLKPQPDSGSETKVSSNRNSTSEFKSCQEKVPQRSSRSSISFLMNDLKREMSRAVEQLEFLQSYL